MRVGRRSNNSFKPSPHRYCLDLKVDQGGFESTSHTENAFFAKSTPMVIVRMETSSSVDGRDATPSWPSRP